MPIVDIINRYSFVTKWSDEDMVYIAYALELPSVKAHGIDVPTAINELKTALLISIQWMQEDGLPIPQPTLELTA
jgi:predicted RNase H-like HicB family nuclease